MLETNEMRGRLTLQLTDRSGHMVFERRENNRIVRSGRELVAQLFGGVTAGTPPAKVTHMGIGTSATDAADADTALGGERLPRKAISSITYTDIDDPVPDGGGATIKRVKASLSTVFDFADGNDPATPLREAGVFTADTAGVMYNRVVFDPVTKTNAFKLTLLWDIIF